MELYLLLFIIIIVKPEYLTRDMSTVNRFCALNVGTALFWFKVESSAVLPIKTIKS